MAPVAFTPGPINEPDLNLCTLQDQVLAQKTMLGAERDKLQRGLERLIDAIATGAGSTTILTRIQEGERRLQQIERELKRCAPPQIDHEQIEAELRGALADWRGALRRHIPQARQMLRKVLVGKLVMQPVRVGRKGAFDFTGMASLGKLITGLAGFPHTVASPPGTARMRVVK